MVSMLQYLSILFLVHLHHTMDNRNISILDLKDYYLACSNRVVMICEKENVTALEGRLHGTTSRRDQNMLIRRKLLAKLETSLAIP